mgnify:FL=1
MDKTLRGALAAALIALAGCAAAPAGQPGLLAFIVDGTTRREDVLLRLGEPGATYENARILAYRLRRDERGYLLASQHDGWAGVHYSLVLVFDTGGVLQRHALVTVNPP